MSKTEPKTVAHSQFTMQHRHAGYILAASAFLWLGSWTVAMDKTVVKMQPLLEKPAAAAIPIQATTTSTTSPKG